MHLLFACRTDGEGNTYGMSEILSGIKGASAHSVNRLLNRRGHVWQDETFDHILRCEDSIHEAAQYICQNPVRKGLVQSENAWPWLWRSWIEGAAEADFVSLDIQFYEAAPAAIGCDLLNVARPPSAVIRRRRMSR